MRAANLNVSWAWDLGSAAASLDAVRGTSAMPAAGPPACRAGQAFLLACHRGRETEQAI